MIKKGVVNMHKSENFRDYPKIIDIERNGQIIGLDKKGRINKDFNAGEINSNDFYDAFGQDYDLLHEKYVREHLSRYERNKDSYTNDAADKRPEDYYNERDFKRDLEQQNEIKKSKSKNKWLVALLVVAAIIIAFIFISKYVADKNSEVNQANEAQNANNEQLQQEINDTKSQLQSSQQNEQDTQQKINDLQSKIDNMNDSNSNNSKGNELQSGVNQLQEAQNNKVNGNKEEMKENLKKVDDAIDTEKISEKGKNQWEKFKNWINDNF